MECPDVRTAPTENTELVFHLGQVSRSSHPEVCPALFLSGIAQGNEDRFADVVQEAKAMRSRLKEEPIPELQEAVAKRLKELTEARAEREVQGEDAGFYPDAPATMGNLNGVHTPSVNTIAAGKAHETEQAYVKVANLVRYCPPSVILTIE
jgi:hypothetical protein